MKLKMFWIYYRLKRAVNESFVFNHPGEDVEEEDWEDSMCYDCHEGEGP